MRQKIIAGFSAPLLLAAFAVVMAGCPTGIVDTSFPNAPKIVNIYAIDDNPQFRRTAPNFFASLPSVAIYSANDPRVSAKAPPSYNGFRIEFDQPIKPQAFGDISDRTGPLNLSFCNQTSTIKVKDVAEARYIPSSTCYNPASVVGSNPNVTVFVGPEAADPTAKAFTCQSFATSDYGLKGAAQYAIEFDTAALKGSNEKSLTLPTSGTGGSFSANAFTFSTAGMEPLAGYSVDPSTGFNIITQKPSLGFQRDLDANATQRVPANSDPFYVPMSMGVVTDDDGAPINAAGAVLELKVTRTKDGSVFTTNIDNGTEGELGRTFEIFPPGQFGTSTCLYTVGFGCTAQWEPNVEYSFILPAGLQGVDALGVKHTMANATTFVFKIADQKLEVVGSEPPPNQISVRFENPTFSNAGARSRTLQVQYPLPVDATALSGITLKDAAGAAVAFTTDVPDSQNRQVVFIKLTDKLLPSSTYTLSMTGIKTAADSADRPGQPYKDYTATFTTIAFAISSTTERNAVFGSGVKAHNIDRVATITPFIIHDGSLRIDFNDAPTNVPISGTPTNIKLLEVKPDATTVEVPITVTGSSGSTFRAIKAANTSEKVKFSTRYIVRALPDITNGMTKNGAPVTLAAEGCTTPSAENNNCADQRTFTTGAFAPILTVTDPATGALTIQFGHNDVTRNPDRINRYTYDIDASSISASLPAAGTERTKAVKLFKKDKDTGALTQVGTSCTIPTANTDTITCQATEPLTNNNPYLYSVGFSSDAPAKVADPTTAKILRVFQGTSRADSAGSKPADQTTGRFVGSRTAAFTSACAP